MESTKIRKIIERRNSTINMAKLTEKEQIFQNLKQIADAIHALFGPNCEVVIHDLANLQKSLVYMKGDVTGRKVGAPATDLLAKLIQQIPEKGDHQHNYKSVTADGRCLKSATTIIKNQSGKAVAAFCINLDTTQYFNAIQSLMPFIHDLETGIYPSKESFADSASDTVRTLFVQAVEEIGVQPASMSIDEKTRFIEKMKQNGVFQFKGAVEQVAGLMDVTKCTVYNYLKKVS
jgi:predicted transcriptional regulator YheO